MCVGSVCTHPSYNDKNPPSILFFKSPFSNQAALRFLSEWHSSAEAAPTIVDCQDRLTLDPPWVSGELSTIVSAPVQGKTKCLRLSDWGVLLLDGIMHIVVVIQGVLTLCVLNRGSFSHPWPSWKRWARARFGWARAQCACSVSANRAGAQNRYYFTFINLADAFI